MSPFFLAIYGGLPLVLYLALAVVPRGRPAALALAGGAGLVAWVWWAAGDDPWQQVLGGFLGGAVVLAGLAQGLRLVLPRGYLLIVPGLAVLTAAVLIYLMGV